MDFTYDGLDIYFQERMGQLITGSPWGNDFNIVFLLLYGDKIDPEGRVGRRVRQRRCQQTHGVAELFRDAVEGSGGGIGEVACSLQNR